MATSLTSFMNAHRAPKGSKKWNITGMDKADVGIYYIPDEEYDAFITLYYQHVFQQRKFSSLLERHGAYTPLLIDLDLHYPTIYEERQFDEDNIVSWLEQYSSAFYHFFEYDKPLRFFVMFRPELTQEVVNKKSVIKDGVHIVCGDITFEYHVSKTLRAYTLEKGIMDTFPTIINPKEDAVDEAVIQRNNWFLYGATKKPERAAYMVDYCYVCHPDGRIESIADWNETDADLIRLFSLKLNRETPELLTIRSDARDEWNTWRSIACADGNKIKERAPDNELIVTDAASTCSQLSEGIGKIMKMSNYIWNVEECEKGYKLLHNAKDCLVAQDEQHDDSGHSCLFVQKSCATMFCFSHKSKKVPRAKASLLWNLLTNGENDATTIERTYTAKKSIFEERNFRILHPPGYMTQIDNTWVHYTRQQLIDMNSGIFLDDDKKERFIDWWLKDEKIRTYSRTGYFVDVSECPTTVYNTFRGFAGSYAESIPCSIDAILYHLLSVVSSNDSAVYEFILDWLAAIVQSPRNLNGICLVIIGQHGAGKDILFNWFGSRVIGMEAYYKTARPNIDMFGSFNSSRLNRVFYHIEEGNEKAITGEYVEQFKNSITDEFASIQLKGRDTFANDINYNHFVVSSNNVVPFDIHRDERRFFAVRVSNAHVRDDSYFKSLGNCLKAPGVVRAFYDMLIDRDTTKRDWKNPPITEALKEWKHGCESGVSVFLEHYRTMNPDVTEIKSSDLFTTYSSYCREYRQTAVKLRQFGMEVKRLLGDPVHGRTGNYYEFKNAIINTA